jgi:hypothetical protein
MNVKVILEQSHKSRRKEVLVKKNEIYVIKENKNNSYN